MKLLQKFSHFSVLVFLFVCVCVCMWKMIIVEKEREGGEVLHSLLPLGINMLCLSVRFPSHHSPKLVKRAKNGTKKKFGTCLLMKMEKKERKMGF